MSDDACFHKQHNGVCVNCALRAAIGAIAPGGVDARMAGALSVALVDLSAWIGGAVSDDTFEQLVAGLRERRAQYVCETVPTGGLH